MKRLFTLVLLLPLAGCGYHQVGAATHIPASVRTVSVPIFHSKVQAYHTETAFTEAVVRELNTRTRYRVLTNVNPTVDRKSTRLNSSHLARSRMPSSA